MGSNSSRASRGRVCRWIKECTLNSDVRKNKIIILFITFFFFQKKKIVTL